MKKIKNFLLLTATMFAFTLSASAYDDINNLTFLDVDNLNFDGNTISSTDTDGDINLTPNGTGEVVSSKVNFGGGEIDGTAIGANTASTGAFTTLSASGKITASESDGITFGTNRKIFSTGSGRLTAEAAGAIDFYTDTNNNDSSSSNALTIRTGDTASGGTETIIFSVKKNGDLTVNSVDLTPEEGTFTPNLGGTGAAGTNSYTTQDGNYVRIGDNVFFDIELQLDGTSGALDSTGILFINNFPFNPVEDSFVGFVNVVTGLTGLSAGDIVFGRMRELASRDIYLQIQDATGSSDFNASSATDSLHIRISGRYRTT